MLYWVVAAHFTGSLLPAVDYAKSSNRDYKRRDGCEGMIFVFQFHAGNCDLPGLVCWLAMPTACSRLLQPGRSGAQLVLMMSTLCVPGKCILIWVYRQLFSCLYRSLYLICAESSPPSKPHLQACCRRRHEMPWACQLLSSAWRAFCFKSAPICRSRHKLRGVPNRCCPITSLANLLMGVWHHSQTGVQQR